jgi:branched-subunit amino acid ABC-type transport system permease component
MYFLGLHVNIYGVKAAIGGLSLVFHKSDNGIIASEIRAMTFDKGTSSTLGLTLKTVITLIFNF